MERKNMEKKTKNTVGNRNGNPTPQGSNWPDETIIRYITRALVLLIVFAWALVNLDAVLRFFGKVLALFTPFLIGGAIAFLINVILRPLECCWNKACRKVPAKLTRPVCLTASTVLILGILFAVVFMMLPSLRESGDEFIQNIPVYVEKIGRWWAGVVQFAAKYNIVLPEYVIDSDLLIEKVTALLSDEGSGILTVTWGAATSVLSVLVDVLLGLVFALYLLAKKEVIAAHLKKLKSAISQHLFSQEPNVWNRLDNLFVKGKAGGTPISTNKEYYNGNIPFLSINDITRQGKYIWLTEKHISLNGLENSSAWIVPKHSLIMSMYASVGLVTINQVPIATSQAMFSMLLRDKSLLDYLYYYLSYFKYRHIHKYLETGTQSNINADIVSGIMIPDYGYRHNMQIASMLQSIDMKIDNESSILERYSQQKNDLLSSLFI